MTAGGQQSGLVQRETVLKSHRLNAFSSPCVHQSVLEQDTEVFPAKFISYSAMHSCWQHLFDMLLCFFDNHIYWYSRNLGCLRFDFTDFVSAGEAVEPLPEQGVSEVPAIRKPSKETTWLGPKESAVRQHRQEMKTKMKTNKVEEVKPARPKQVRRSYIGELWK